MSPIGFGIGRSLIYITLAMMTALPPVWAATGQGAEHGGQSSSDNRVVVRQILKRLRQAHWVSEGHSQRILYVFFDPNCPYCHILYDVSQHFVRSGLVEVRWIPVGLLTPTSLGKAAAILEARDPRAALEQNEDHYRRPGGGGIDEVLPTRMVARQLKANLALFHETGGGGVPLIVWDDETGHMGIQDGAIDKETFAYLIRRVRPQR